MKRMLSQKLIDKLAELVDAQGVEWVSQMKELISYDEDEDIISILHSYVKMAGTEFSEDVYLNGISSLRDVEEDVPFFPSLTDQAGKCVVVNDDETGFEYAEKGTKLYLHELTGAGEVDYFTIISTSPNPIAIDSQEAFYDNYRGIVKITCHEDISSKDYLVLDLHFVSEDDELHFEFIPYGETSEILGTDDFTDAVDTITPL